MPRHTQYRSQGINSWVGFEKEHNSFSNLARLSKFLQHEIDKHYPSDPLTPTIWGLNGHRFQDDFLAVENGRVLMELAELNRKLVFENGFDCCFIQREFDSFMKNTN